MIRGLTDLRGSAFAAKPAMPSVFVLGGESTYRPGEVGFDGEERVLLPEERGHFPPISAATRLCSSCREVLDKDLQVAGVG